MDFSGQLPMAVPRAYAIAGCHRAENLSLLLPVTGTITQTDAGRYALQLTPNIPVLRASLPGTLAVTVIEPDAVYDLRGEAGLWRLGGIVMKARMQFSGEGDTCLLTYEGTVETSGLLSHATKSREKQIRSRVEGGFDRLRLRIQQEAAEGR